jgi:hypothetical protein
MDGKGGEKSLEEVSSEFRMYEEEPIGASNRTPFWILFPMEGLIIGNKKSNLLEPMFADATLLSHRDIKRIVHSTKLSRGKPVTRAREGDTVKSLTATHTGFDAHSFLAIRKMVNVDSIAGREKENREKKAQVVSSAKERAYEVAAALCFVVLAVEPSGHTCGLVEDIPRKVETHSGFSLETGFWTGGFTTQEPPLTPRGMFFMTRRELKSILFQRHFAPLTNVLMLKQRSDVQGELRIAALYLYNAIHAATPSLRVLGSVSSMELLLGSDFDKLRQRTKTLLGREEYERLHVEKVIEARSKYVHEGREIQDKEIQLRAVGSALTVLFRFAEAAQHFRNKGDVQDYLDWLDEGARWGARRLSEAEQQLFDRLVLGPKLRHTPAGYPFLWLPRR